MEHARLLPALAAALAVSLAACITPAHAAVSVADASGSAILLDVEAGTTGVRIWLPEGSSFTGCKAVAGWECSLVSGTAEFASSGMSGGKIAIITDAPVPEFYWSSSGPGGGTEAARHILGAGSAADPEPTVEPAVDPPSDPAGDPPAPPEPKPSITDDSEFRIVPKSPGVGSPIRVVGERLGPMQQFEFSIGGREIGSFRSDGDGSFVGTARIPSDIEPGRTGFVLSGPDAEREASYNIGGPAERIPATIQLTISNAPDTLRRGETINVSGTGRPGGTVTAEITAPDGSTVRSGIAEIGTDGTWGDDEGTTIPHDAQLGMYSAVITDGRDTISRSWRVVSGEGVVMEPARVKFGFGDPLRFTGTAPAGELVEVTLEDPGGREIISDYVRAGPGGEISFEFPTTKSTPEGVYTLVSTLGGERSFSYAGYQVLPRDPINVELDRFHYTDEPSASVTVSGRAFTELGLLIVETANNKEVHKGTLQVGPGGIGIHEIDLEGFKSTVYSAVVRKGNVQSEEEFAVNLKTDPPNLAIQATKERYAAGEQMVITGNTMEPGVKSGPKASAPPPSCKQGTPAYLVEISLVDPGGNATRTKHSYADTKCQLSDETFRIPTDARPGIWTVRGESGHRLAEYEIEVARGGQAPTSISVTEGEEVANRPSLLVSVAGAEARVSIEVTHGGEVVDTLRYQVDEHGEVSTPWLVPAGAEPGAYTFTVTEGARNGASATYELEG